jgi:hypothetical protein
MPPTICSSVEMHHLDKVKKPPWRSGPAPRSSGFVRDSNVAAAEAVHQFRTHCCLKGVAEDLLSDTLQNGAEFAIEVGAIPGEPRETKEANRHIGIRESEAKGVNAMQENLFLVRNICGAARQSARHSLKPATSEDSLPEGFVLSALLVDVITAGCGSFQIAHGNEHVVDHDIGSRKDFCGVGAEVGALDDVGAVSFKKIMLQTGAGDGVNAVLAFSQAEACIQSKASKELY